MNVIIFTLVAFIVIYLLLRLIARVPTKKLSAAFRILIFLGSLLLAILLAFGGRFLFSLPLILLSLGIIKLKGLTLYQIIGLFRLLQYLRSSNRFSFNQRGGGINNSTLSIDESYKILNLDRSKKITKEDVKKAHAKIQKKIHPDISPETTRLSSLVNEAKEIVLRDIT
tara:strand:+ start:1121 stop:1627 length:507 start_codon:yes stop_codon:yes gene_type:complete